MSVECGAEDGIRDWSVTGVQTCALPISREAERLAGPDLADDLDHFLDPLAPGLPVDPEVLELGPVGAADAEHEPAVRDHVERRGLLGHVEIGRASCRERG